MIKFVLTTLNTLMRAKDLLENIGLVGCKFGMKVATYKRKMRQCERGMVMNDFGSDHIHI